MHSVQNMLNAGIPRQSLRRHFGRRVRQHTIQDDRRINARTERSRNRHTYVLSRELFYLLHEQIRLVFQTKFPQLGGIVFPNCVKAYFAHSIQERSRDYLQLQGIDMSHVSVSPYDEGLDTFIRIGRTDSIRLAQLPGLVDEFGITCRPGRLVRTKGLGCRRENRRRSEQILGKAE